MFQGSIDSQIGAARICNGLGIMRTCLETATLERIGDGLDELEGIRGYGDTTHNQAHLGTLTSSPFASEISRTRPILVYGPTRLEAERNGAEYLALYPHDADRPMQYVVTWADDTIASSSAIKAVGPAEPRVLSSRSYRSACSAARC